MDYGEGQLEDLTHVAQALLPPLSVSELDSRVHVASLPLQLQPPVWGVSKALKGHIDISLDSPNLQNNMVNHVQNRDSNVR